MPIPPSPIRYRCVQCGWSTITRPKSDCLLPGDIIHRCPQCESAKIQSETLNSSLVMLNNLFSLIKGGN